MQFDKYVRVPFLVEAVEITEENFDEVAALIAKEVVETGSGRRQIVIDRDVIRNGHKANIGGWLTRMDGKYRYYSKTAFEQQFVPSHEYSGDIPGVDFSAEKLATPSEPNPVPDITGQDIINSL